MHELTWTTPDGDVWPIEVVAPVEEAEQGWPVVISFHGSATTSATSGLWSVPAAGIVLVTPRWVDPDWSVTNTGVLDPNIYVDGAYFDVAACAYAAAQEVAAEHGGDIDRTTVDGFSAGVHPAAWVAFGVVREDRCPDADYTAPIAVAVGDSQFLFEGVRGEWDSAFRDPDSNAVDTVDRFLNPERWTVDDDLRILLWSTTSTVVNRAVDDPPAADSWIRDRGDEQLITDLEELDQFSDGTVGFIDSANLLAYRAEAAGFDVTHAAMDTGHTRSQGEQDLLIALAWGEEIDLE